MSLAKWMRDEEIYDKDLVTIFEEYNVCNEDDFANVTEQQWDNIYRKAKVERFQELKDQQSRSRLEQKLSKIEKFWREKSGIKKILILKRIWIYQIQKKNQIN